MTRDCEQHQVGIKTWLVAAGHGCVPINLMEDAATAEISRSQIGKGYAAQRRLVDAAKLRDLFREMLADELRNSRLPGPDDGARKYPEAARSRSDVHGDYVEFDLPGTNGEERLARTARMAAWSRAAHFRR